MGFSLGAFSRGFASAAVEDKREKENEVKDLIKTSYLTTLEEAKTLRKERRAKREKLKDIGSQLQSMQLSDSQVAGILANGVDGAKHQLDVLRQAQEKYGTDFDVNSFVSAAEETNLTIDDAIDRIMGTRKQITGQATLPDIAVQDTFFGSTEGASRKQLDLLSSTFGEDYAGIQAEVAGDYEYGEVPKISVDYTKLNALTKDEEAARKLRELQIKKAEADLRDAEKPEEISDTTQKTLISGLHSKIVPILEDKYNTKLSYNPTTDTYVLPPEANARQQAAYYDALELATQGLDLMRGADELQFVDALKQQMEVAKGRTYTVAEDQQLTVDSVPMFNPTESTPAEFALDMYGRLGVDEMNPTDKRNAKETIRRAMLSGDINLPLPEAQRILNELFQ